MSSTEAIREREIKCSNLIGRLSFPWDRCTLLICICALTCPAHAFHLYNAIVLFLFPTFSSSFLCHFFFTNTAYTYGSPHIWYFTHSLFSNMLVPRYRNCGGKVVWVWIRLWGPWYRYRRGATCLWAIVAVEISAPVRWVLAYQTVHATSSPDLGGCHRQYRSSSPTRSNNKHSNTYYIGLNEGLLLSFYLWHIYGHSCSTYEGISGDMYTATAYSIDDSSNSQRTSSNYKSFGVYYM